ncbi:cytochrome P450 [Penicillium angulare]|uniref:cytochrome P450 n=1 Tax=Penicillium angulare TaxID=116970 RepID=UPI0025421D2F|nr:cytochrome P450 [Penicillium angulare]KAJ5274032.1 cytochrome P450 [Penicillium angulare]
MAGEFPKYASSFQHFLTVSQTAVIKESLRLTALVTSRLPLVSPDKALCYKWTIPPGTPVSMTLRDVLLDPTIFPDPQSFFPERWFHSTSEMEHAFALAELYMCLGYLLRELDLELYDTHRGRGIDTIRDCFIGEVSPDSKGVRVAFARDPLCGSN